ncbi:hypothetical protein LJC69_01870, partial [Bacteroidales bacterium OttesenSCG-928-K22]|nr:hypothetical protein [Bacteroidales bacterium OttesenSCG-928-K22]
QGNNGQIIFRDDYDKQRFLDKLEHYTSPFVVIITRVLLPDHFHIVLQIKTDFGDNMRKYANMDKVIRRFKRISSREEESIIISELLRRFFMSYAKYYNRKYNQTGSLFRKNYRRVLLNSKEELKRVIIFTHRNVQIHGLVKNFRNYKWSMYHMYKDESNWTTLSGKIFQTLFKDYAGMELEHDIHDDDDWDIQIE